MVSYITTNSDEYSKFKCNTCLCELKTDVVVHAKKNKEAPGPEWQCAMHKNCLKAWLKYKKTCPTCLERVNDSSLVSYKERSIELLQSSARGAMLGAISFGLMEAYGQMHHRDPESYLAYIPLGIFTGGGFTDILLNFRMSNCFVAVISSMVGTRIRMSAALSISDLVARTLFSSLAGAATNVGMDMIRIDALHANDEMFDISD
jgi:hypothetical protein